MKSLKQDAEYIVDSFVDFKGDEHKIIGCVLNVKPYSNIGERFSVGWRSDGHIWIDDPDFRDIQEIISVGIMVCHPCDEFDLERERIWHMKRLCIILNVRKCMLALKGESP